MGFSLGSGNLNVAAFAHNFGSKISRFAVFDSVLFTRLCLAIGIDMSIISGFVTPKVIFTDTSKEAFI